MTAKAQFAPLSLNFQPPTSLLTAMLRCQRPGPWCSVDPALRKSITFDNDTAFAQHALLRTMRAMTTWFCDAYASWQKGGVENANGRLRRWLPRQIDIDKVSDQEIQDIVMTRQSHAQKMPGTWYEYLPGPRAKDSASQIPLQDCGGAGSHTCEAGGHRGSARPEDSRDGSLRRRY